SAANQRPHARGVARSTTLSPIGSRRVLRFECCDYKDNRIRNMSNEFAKRADWWTERDGLLNQRQPNQHSNFQHLKKGTKMKKIFLPTLAAGALASAALGLAGSAT